MKLIKGKKYIITGFDTKQNTKDKLEDISSEGIKFPQTVMFNGEFFFVEDNPGYYEYATSWFNYKEAKPATIEKYKSRGQITFRVKSSNGKVLNHKYNTSQGCDKGIEALKKALSNYKVIDLTK